MNYYCIAYAFTASIASMRRLGKASAESNQALQFAGVLVWLFTWNQWSKIIWSCIIWLMWIIWCSKPRLPLWRLPRSCFRACFLRRFSCSMRAWSRPFAVERRVSSWHDINSSTGSCNISILNRHNGHSMKFDILVIIISFGWETFSSWVPHLGYKLLSSLPFEIEWIGTIVGG